MMYPKLPPAVNVDGALVALDSTCRCGHALTHHNLRLTLERGLIRRIQGVCDACHHDFTAIEVEVE